MPAVRALRVIESLNREAAAEAAQSDASDAAKQSGDEAVVAASS
jgi:hypothetical protein